MTREKKIMLRFTEDEKKLVDAYAKKNFTPLATLARQLLLQLAAKDLV